jgi:hypothetical protein
VKYPPNSFKSRAHALVHELPDNATWRDLIDTGIERMDLDAEAASAHAASSLNVADAPPTEYDA